MISTLFNKLYFETLKTSNQKKYLIYNRKRFQKLYTIVLELKPKKILDIGESDFSTILKRSNLNLTIINKRNCDLEKDRIPYKQNTFDLVIYTEVIEHLRKNHFNSLREIKRILKPGGKVLFGTPNKNGLHRLLYTDLNDTHFKIFDLQECKQFFNKLHMKIIYNNYENYLDYPKKDLIHYIYYLIVSLVPFFRESLLIIAKK